MKNTISLFSALLLLLASVANAQDTFEGTITYGIEVESNEFAGLMGSMMPDEYVYSMKDGKVRFEMKGGMAAMMGAFIVDPEKNLSYMLQSGTKTAFEFETDQQQEANEPTPKITKTDEYQTIAGYKCRKVLVEIPQQGQQVFWVTNEIKFDMSKMNIENIGSTGQILVKGLEGMPLKTEMNLNTNGMNMKVVTTAEKVEKKILSAKLFEVPADYTIKEFDPSSLMGRF